MSFCRRLCRYFRFWRRSKIAWRRLFSESKDKYLIISFIIVTFFGILHLFQPDSYNMPVILEVFIIFSVSVFWILFLEWLIRKWRVIFPKQILMHPNVDRDIELAWRGEEYLLTSRFNRTSIGLPDEGFQTPRMSRHFMFQTLESGEMSSLIYPRNRRSNRVLQRPRSVPRSLYGQTTKWLRDSIVHSQSFPSHYIEMPLDVVQNLSTSSSESLRDDQLSQRQISSIEVHAAMDDERRLCDKRQSSLYSKINYGASSSKVSVIETSQNQKYRTPQKQKESFDDILPYVSEEDDSIDADDKSSNPFFLSVSSRKPVKSDTTSKTCGIYADYSSSVSGSLNSESDLNLKSPENKTSSDEYLIIPTENLKCIKLSPPLIEIHASETPETLANIDIDKTMDIDNIHTLSNKDKESAAREFSDEVNSQIQLFEQGESLEEIRSKRYQSSSNPASVSGIGTCKNILPKKIATESQCIADEERSDLHGPSTSARYDITVSPVKRKKESSSEEEECIVHGKQHSPSCSSKHSQKIPKVSEPDDSE